MLTIETIRSRAIPIANKYKVIRLELFGSYATGNATETSDADFLAEFTEPIPSIFAVMGFKEELSRSLGMAVDVVTLPLVRPDVLKVGKTEVII